MLSGPSFAKGYLSTNLEIQTTQDSRFIRYIDNDIISSSFTTLVSVSPEIMDGFPTAVVVASKYLYHAVTIQRMLSTLIFRVYTSQDIIGVELGGALKNPLAIGAGMIEGMGFKVNTMAAYVTRSSLELQVGFRFHHIKYIIILLSRNVISRNFVKLWEENLRL